MIHTLRSHHPLFPISLEAVDRNVSMTLTNHEVRTMNCLEKIEHHSIRRSLFVYDTLASFVLINMSINPAHARSRVRVEWGRHKIKSHSPDELMVIYSLITLPSIAQWALPSNTNDRKRGRPRLSPMDLLLWPLLWVYKENNKTEDCSSRFWLCHRTLHVTRQETKKLIREPLINRIVWGTITMPQIKC